MPIFTSGTAARPYDAAIRTNPNPGATFDGAVSWQKENIGWHTGRLLLKDGEISLDSDGNTVFKAKISQVELSIARPSSEYYLVVGNDTYGLRLFLSSLNPFKQKREYNKLFEAVAAAQEKASAKL